MEKPDPEFQVIEKAQLGMFIPRDIFDRVKIKAKKKNTSMTDVVTQLLKLWVQNKITIKKDF